MKVVLQMIRHIFTRTRGDYDLQSPDHVEIYNRELRIYRTLSSARETDVLLIYNDDDVSVGQTIFDTLTVLRPELRVLRRDGAAAGRNELDFYLNAIKSSTYVLIILSHALAKEICVHRLKYSLLRNTNLIIHDIGHRCSDFIKSRDFDISSKNDRLQCHWCSSRLNKTDIYNDCHSSEAFARIILSKMSNQMFDICS